MSSTGSFKAYRDELAQTAPPAVPYVGLLLTDLTFLETNANTVDGLINFTKRARMHALIDEAVVRFQSATYNLQVVPQVQALLAAQPAYTEDELYAISVAREQREPED